MTQDHAGTGENKVGLVTVEIKRLQAALGVLKRTVGGVRAPLPSTRNVRIEGGQWCLRLETTDLEKTGRVTLPATASGEDVWAVTIPHDKLSGVVGKCKGEVVDLEPDGDRGLTLRSGSVSARLHGDSVDDFPPRPGGDWRLLGEIELEDVEAVLHAAATDGSRPVLTSVLFDVLEDKVQAVTANGSVLAVRQVRGRVLDAWDVRFKVPATALGELCKALRKHKGLVEVLRVPEGHNTMFWAPGYEMIVQDVTGTFPNYGLLMPDPSAARWTARFKVAALLDALDVVGMLAREGSGIVRVWTAAGPSGGPGELHVEARAEDAGEIGAVIESKNGGLGKIAFNYNYLHSMLKSCPEEEVCLYGTTNTSLALFTSGPHTEMVMPMYVQW